MESDLIDTPWQIWLVALVVGFPLTVILIGEVVHRLEGRWRPLAATLRLARNLVVPTLVVLLFVDQVLGYGAEHSGRRVIETLFWICALHAALSLLNAVLFAQAEAESWRARVPALLRDLARLLLVLLGVALVLSTVWGADLGGLLTALGVGSIVIGLALQDTLSNVVSGIALLFESPFRVGDWLRVGDRVGRVIEINWRAVRLETRQREMLVVPNVALGQDTLVNYSQPQALHAERMVVGFSYDDPPNRVKSVLMRAALDTRWVHAEPPPEIRTEGFGDSAIDYELEVFVDDYSQVEEVRDELFTRLWYAARRGGLSIPFPIRTVYNHDAAKTSDGAEDLAERMKSIPELVPVQKEDLGGLPMGGIQSYGKGEYILRQGQTVEALFIILTGQAIVHLEGLDQEVARLEQGQFFGEMGVLQGEPSSASVRAACDMEVIAIPAESVGSLLERTPRLARELGSMIESRRKVNLEVREQNGTDM